MEASIARIVGWLTILGAAITIISLVFLILFFSKGQPYGTLNDITSIFQVLLMLPVLILFVIVLQPGNPTLPVIAAVIGVIGVLVSGMAQTLLVFRMISFEQSVSPNMIGGGLIGVWLVLTNGLARSSGIENGVLPWIGIAAGIGYVALVIGFSLGGQNHPLFQVGGGVTALSYPVWAIWLGILLIYGKLSLPV